MHSIRELAGSQDAFKLTKVLVAFYGLAELGVAN
jgi:aspartyl aminopeptidase